ncbi:hypothetical protein M885DRAFT_624946 [Pelagophyceae sp. CCMP2097]|nr:hypothetical protein M885DRAFT_624946 [Pelagophyceae sp. CCMP2097]
MSADPRGGGDAPAAVKDGRAGEISEGHNAWYQTEVERGRRFHGAFEGGFSAGYHNTVGSEAGWAPGTFSSSRSKRQKVVETTAQDFADEADGLLGARLEVSAGYAAAKPARAPRGAANAPDAGAAGDDAFGEALRRATASGAPTESPHGRRMLRLLGWRDGDAIGASLKGRRAALAGGADFAKVADGGLAAVQNKADRHCVGYGGALARSGAASFADDNIIRVADALGGRGPAGAARLYERSTDGFALHDDEDDVYDAAPSARGALMALDDGSDDDATARPALRFGAAPAAVGLLAPASQRGSGILAQFVRSLELRPAASAHRIQDPPRHWQRKHVFSANTPNSAWLQPGPRGTKTIQQRAAALGEEHRGPETADETAVGAGPPPPPPPPNARGGPAGRPMLAPRGGGPGGAAQFAGLAAAMASRFSAAGVTPAAVADGAKAPMGQEVRQPGLQTPSLTASAAPAGPAPPLKPARRCSAWQPLPLVCKRFTVPLPVVLIGATEATLRCLQFDGQSADSLAGNVTTASTTSKLFDDTLGEFLPGGNQSLSFLQRSRGVAAAFEAHEPARGQAPTRPLQQSQAAAPTAAAPPTAALNLDALLPTRPSVEVFKAIFEPLFEEPEAPAVPGAAAPAAARGPDAPVSADDFFTDMFGGAAAAASPPGAAPPAPPEPRRGDEPAGRKRSADTAAPRASKHDEPREKKAKKEHDEPREKNAKKAKKGKQGKKKKKDKAKGSKKKAKKKASSLAVASTTAQCVGNETKPKGEVWKWFKKVPAEKHGGPLGLQCLGAGCPKIYFQAIPNATKLARHAAACCALPQSALEDPDSEGPILIE